MRSTFSPWPPSDATALLAGVLVTGTPPRVLLVEDDGFLAIHLARELDAAGFAVVGPAATVAEALRLLGEEGCDAGVLDVSLGRDTSEAVALELALRGLPFVVVSGYARAQHPAIFSTAPSLTKPVQTDALVAELHRLLRLP